MPDPPSDEPEGDEILTDGVFLFEGPTWGTYAIVGVRDEVGETLTVLTIPQTFTDPGTGIEYPVTDLRSGCLSGCANLTILTVPATIESIGSDVFRGCGKLTAVYLYGTSPSMLTVPESGLFDGAAPSLTVYVPRGTISAFGSNYSWMGYKDLLDEFDPE